jgi:DNA polymerase-3 subunit delta'
VSAELPGIERHPHARALLVPALPPGSASHAYLFSGPAGSGKRTTARSFAAALIADGAPDQASARERALRGAHPDLTWVVPSGAAEMLVSDIDEAVVAAAARTPFEARRRVFVIERAEALGDATANRLLKTLEEPASFVHLILITARPADVLETVASRCQLVRFEAPSVAQLAADLRARDVAAEQAEACARLGLGDRERALALALGEGPALREHAERYASAALRDELAERPWLALLDLAKRAGELASATLAQRQAQELELLARAERTRAAREHEEALRRTARRHAQAALDLALATAALVYRDAATIALGAPELVHATDRREQLAALADEQGAPRLQRALALVDPAREALALNATEELTLESLAYRIAALPRESRPLAAPNTV